MNTSNFTEKMKAFSAFNLAQKMNEPATVDYPAYDTPYLMGMEKNGIKIEFLPSNRKKVRKVTVVIQGEFTLRNTTEAINAIAPAFNQFDIVSINLKNISCIDLAAIQCLFKIKCIQEANGKTVSLDSELPKEYKDLIYVSGLLPLVSNTKLTA